MFKLMVPLTLGSTTMVRSKSTAKVRATASISALAKFMLRPEGVFWMPVFKRGSEEALPLTELAELDALDVLGVLVSGN